MKTMKKAFALVLALAIVMSLGITAFAVDPTYTITIKNTPATSGVSIVGQVFEAYKIFDVTYDLSATGKPHTYTLAALLKDNGFAWDHDGDNKSEDKPAGHGTPAETAPLTGDKLVDFLAKTTNEKRNEFARFTYNWMKTTNNGGTGAKVLAAAKNESSAGALLEDKKTESAVFNLDKTGGTTKNGPGYYLIYAVGKDGDASLTSALYMDTTNPKAEAEIKLKAPTLVKKADGKDFTAAQIGDVVTFTLETYIPKGFDGYDSYRMTFSDTMDAGLVLTNDDFVVKVNDTQVTVTKPGSQALMDKTRDGCQLLIADNAASFELVFPDLTKDLATGAAPVTPAEGQKILITYKAKVTDDSKAVSAVFNHATLSYSNNPTNSTYPDPGSIVPPDPDSPLIPENTTPEEKTRVYNFAIDVYKYVPGSGSTKTPLAGVAFKLYKVVTPSVGDPVNKYYKYTSDGVSWVDKADGDSKVTNNDGNLTTLSFVGLEPGVYYLEETVTPAGYNGLDNPIRVTIAENYGTKQNEADETVTDYTKLLGAKYTIAEMKDGSYANLATQPDPVPFVDGETVPTVKYAVPVENNYGSELPSTGGIGTTIFYVGGALLMVSALVLLITKKKMSVN